MELATIIETENEKRQGVPNALAMPAPPAREKPRQAALTGVLGPSLLMTALSIVSTGLSFVYQLVVANQFGAAGQMDAYLAAMALPMWLIAVFLTSLQFTFVPVFVEHMARGSEGEEEAWKVAGTLLRLILVGLTPVCLLGMVFAPQLISWVAPGLQGSSHATSIDLFRILLPSIVFAAVFGLLSGIHFSLHSFLWPSLAPVVYTVVNVVVLWLAAPIWGIGSVAAGTTLGQIAQVCLVLPVLRRSWRSLRLFDLRSPGVMRVLALMLPLVAVSLVSRSTDIVERFFASRLPEGSISYLGYSSKLLTPISDILVLGFVTALFPLMAEQAAAGDDEERQKLRHTITRGINLVLFIVLPVAGWLMVLRMPLISVLLERGAFDHRATLGTADAMLFGLGAFAAAGLVGVLSRGFYALKDTRTSARAALFGIAFYVAGCALLTDWLSYLGLALSRSISSLTTALLLAVFLTRKVGGLPWIEVFRSQIRVILACALSAACTLLTWSAIRLPQREGIVGLLVPGCVGLGVFALAAWAVRCDEMLYLSRLAAARLRKKQPEPA